MTSLLLEDKEKLFFWNKKEPRRRVRAIKKELEAERNKGFFSRLFKNKRQYIEIIFLCYNEHRKRTDYSVLDFSGKKLPKFARLR